MMKQKKHTTYGVKISSCLAICALVIACGYSKQCKAPEDMGTAAQMTNMKAEKAYQQMALYIQEGFRTYDIKGTYKAYFGPMEDNYYEDGPFSVDILLNGTDGSWMERIHCSYNREKDWFTFSGSFEPIFTKDTYYYKLIRGYFETDSDSDFVKEMLEDHIYTTEISKT